MRLRIIRAGAAAALLAPAAHAVTFDLTGPGREGRSFSFAADGLSLTVGGALITGDGLSPYGLVGSWSTGLGLRTGQRDSHLVDGSGWGEALMFSFSEEVLLSSVTLSYADRDDDVTLFADLAGGFGEAGRFRLSGFSSIETLTLNDPVLGSLFGVGAGDSNDEFKIRSITVARVEPPLDPPAAIPLPAAAALLAPALAALALIGRRRRS